MPSQPDPDAATEVPHRPAAGRYEYDVSGEMSGFMSGPPARELDMAVTWRPDGRVEIARRVAVGSGQAGSTEVSVFNFGGEGIAVEEMRQSASTGGASHALQFIPVRSAYLLRAGLKPGDSWTNELVSTDGCYRIEDRYHIRDARSKVETGRGVVRAVSLTVKGRVDTIRAGDCVPLDINRRTDLWLSQDLGLVFVEDVRAQSRIGGQTSNLRYRVDLRDPGAVLNR